MLAFNQVVERLRTTAVAISASGFDAPEPEIAVLDVSSFKKAVEKGRVLFGAQQL
jgi:hypothetical protein